MIVICVKANDNGLGLIGTMEKLEVLEEKSETTDDTIGTIKSTEKK